MAGHWDLVVVGGGPGGYPGALLAAELGLSVALVEERGVGGECLLYGCVPTKTLLRYTHALLLASRLGAEGWSPREAWAEAVRVSRRLSQGLRERLKGAGVEVVEARALVRGRGLVEAGGRLLSAGSLLLAPGTVPSVPPPLRGLRRVVDNRGLLEEPPEPGSRILVAGGGAVGVELAAAMAAMGYRVTLLEALPRLLPGLPRGLGSSARRLLTALGVEVHTRCPVAQAEENNGEEIAVEAPCGSFTADLVVAATGRRPATRNLGVEDTGAGLDEKGYILVDERMRAAPGVYAAGDAAGPPLLAHKAIKQSMIAAWNAARPGEPRCYKPRAVPTVIHFPGVELAAAGVSVEEARKQGLAVTRIRLGWSPYALLEGIDWGYVALIYDPRDGRILGFEAAAPGAAGMAAEAALAIEAGLTARQLAETVAPHPEPEEALHEAALAAIGEPIHYAAQKPGEKRR